MALVSKGECFLILKDKYFVPEMRRASRLHFKRVLRRVGSQGGWDEDPWLRMVVG